MALEAHIVTHTHWDREWYHPVERFRQRLVALVDELLDDPPAPGESFLLDGQAIVLDDYLAVRPDRGERLAELLRAGALEAGPWYVLADELIPSGEALVRNLLTGRRTLARFGAQSPPVLYCPDSFGHPAALPALACGFGLPLIILWRGYGGPHWPAGDTVRWSAPNGERVLVYHLPRDGYEFGSHLPTTTDEAVERWRRMRAELVPRCTAGVMLVPNGADHHARQRDLPHALTALERAGVDDGVRRSSLRAFAERVVERVALQPLPAIRGELRDSYGYTWTLQGTFATRAHEKRLNARAERVLVREAEPWCALAAYAGTSRRPLLESAWRSLLEAHPHDTLCGCSIDQVARAMELRLDSAINQGRGLRDDAVTELIGHDPVAARDERDRWTPIVLVRNAAPRVRSGVAIIDVEQFVADVAVGPGSAPASPPPALSLRKPTIPSLGALQILSRETRHSRTESPRHYPDNDLVVATRVAAWVGNIPPIGIASYSIGAGDAHRRPAVNAVTTSARTMENGVLSVSVNDEGDVSLVHPESGRRIDSLIGFVDETDRGDLYTPSVREREFAVRCRGVRLVHRGPLRGELLLRYRVEAPGRSRVADIDVRLVLDAASAVMRIALAIDNRAENHRLRVVLRSGIASPEVWADAAFGALRRRPIAIDDVPSAAEIPPPTAPLHRYVSLFDEAGGFTLISDGLAEYEAAPDGTVAVTLVRAVGELSRNDLRERPGHAGWPAATPDAQCIGRYDAELAVMLHGARVTATIDAIERAADDVLLPLTGDTLRSALAVPPPVTGPELSGAGLAISALKESEDGEWLVLRCVNLRDEESAGRWRLPFPLREARLARIDETVISELAIAGTDVEFTVSGRAIVTVLVR